MASRNKATHDRAPIIVAYIITGVWVISFLVDLFVERYDPPPSVMPLMLIAAGFLFGKEALKKNGGSSSPSSQEADS